MNPVESRVVTTGKDIIAFIENNNLYDAIVRVGCEGYLSDDEGETVIGFDGNRLMIFDDAYYEGYCD